MQNSVEVAPTVVKTAVICVGPVEVTELAVLTVGPAQVPAFASVVTVTSRFVLVAGVVGTTFVNGTFELITTVTDPGVLDVNV
jgi:hypothetical protein